MKNLLLGRAISRHCRGLATESELRRSAPQNDITGVLLWALILYRRDAEYRENLIQTSAFSAVIHMVIGTSYLVRPPYGTSMRLVILAEPQPGK